MSEGLLEYLSRPNLKMYSFRSLILSALLWQVPLPNDVLFLSFPWQILRAFDYFFIYWYYYYLKSTIKKATSSDSGRKSSNGNSPCIHALEQCLPWGLSFGRARLLRQNKDGGWQKRRWLLSWKSTGRVRNSGISVILAWYLDVVMYRHFKGRS